MDNFIATEIKSNYNIYQGEVYPNNTRNCEVYI